MKVEFKISDSLRKKLQVDKKKIADNLERAATDEIAIIKQRTEQGKDVDGRTFAAYTEPYKKVRQFGRKGKNPQTGGKRVHPPNLRVSGKMISAMQTEQPVIQGSKISTKIYFTNQTARDKALGNMKKRDFFSLSKEQEARIKKRLFR